MDASVKFFAILAISVAWTSQIPRHCPDSTDHFVLLPDRKPYGQSEQKTRTSIVPSIASLQGFWQMTEWFGPDGTRAPDDETKTHECAFTDDRYVKYLRSVDFPPRKFTVDSSKTPAWIDFEDGQGRVPMRGICKIEGDELTICVNVGIRGNAPPERPTEFRTNSHNFHTVWVFKKEK